MQPTETLEGLKAERDELRAKLDPRRDRRQYIPIEEVQHFANVSSKIAQSNNVQAISIGLRTHAIIEMVILAFGMFAGKVWGLNPWYVAWALLATTMVHGLYMWWVSSKWAERARKADEEFVVWCDERDRAEG